MKYQCKCCGYYTLSQKPNLPNEPGTFEICRVCGWEDDSSQILMPNIIGANKVSFNQARENFQKFGVSDTNLTNYPRPPFPNELPQNNPK